MKLRLPWCTATALLASESLWVIACGEDSDSSSDSGSARAKTRSHWLRLKVRRVKPAGTGSLRPWQATPKATFQSPCGTKLSLDGPSGLAVNCPWFRVRPGSFLTWHVPVTLSEKIIMTRIMMIVGISQVSHWSRSRLSASESLRVISQVWGRMYNLKSACSTTRWRAAAVQVGLSSVHNERCQAQAR